MNRRNFIQNTGLAFLGPHLLLGHSSDFGSFGTELKYTAPESMGVTSESISAYLQAVHESGLEHHGFIMSRHGKIIAEAYWKPFAANRIHTLYSLSKSFTSTAVGMAVQEGRLKLTDKVTTFFPDLLPATLPDNLTKLEVRHLLNMATGHTKDTMGPMRAAANQSWVKTFFEQPFEKEPGTHFLYNTGSTYMCSAIVSKLTGQTLHQYLTPRLFNPLGIKGSDWEMSPEGYNVAGYGLRISTRDIIKFGNLYLNKGKYNGKQLINEGYVDEATTSHIASTPSGGDWGQGYGYQFWRCRHDFYRGDGAFGQYSIVMQRHGVVVALNSESSNMGKQMELMWTHLLPGIKEGKLAKNKSAQSSLASLSQSLKLNASLGGSNVAIANKKIKLDENEMGLQSIEVNNGTLKMIKPGDITEIPFGWNEWKENNARIMNPFSRDNRSLVPSKVAATAGTDGDVLKIRLKYTEGMHGDLITIKPQPDGMVELSLLGSLAEKGANNNRETRKPLTGKIV